MVDAETVPNISHDEKFSGEEKVKLCAARRFY